MVEDSRKGDKASVIVDNIQRIDWKHRFSGYLIL